MYQNCNPPRQQDMFNVVNLIAGYNNPDNSLLEIQYVALIN